MRTHRYLALAALVALAVGACSPAASTKPSTAASAAASTPPAASPGASASAAASQATASATPIAADPKEAVIPGVEAGAKITFWTFFLSPTFDNYINETVARFKLTYPGVEVTVQDHKGTMREELNTAFAAGNAPDVINLSVSEGWVSEFAGKGLLVDLDKGVPQQVQDIYYPGLWNEQLINDVNYQFPWYQGLNVELINKSIYDKTGLTIADFPKKTQDLPALCKTILEKTSTVCTIRLTMSDLLSQMVYEGNVKAYNADGTSFAFNSPEGVAWLQMYVDMVTAGTVDNTVLTTNDDRVGLNAFAAGTSAFYATGPNLARVVKDTNKTLYDNLAMVQAPIGLSGVTGKGLMAISVNKATKYPQASLALAQFFTNPRSMVQFAKTVAIYPSSPSAYDDPFFADPPTQIEDSGRRLAKDIVATYQDIVPTVVKKGDVNAILKTAIESALFNKVPAQQALDKAVADANKVIK
jgi:ABC-type glycerol-3-phosphate transport system substrate-binding protein